VVECQAGKRAVTIKAFSRSDLVFMDHFPGRELVPGVLLVEMIAQTAVLCMRAAQPSSFAVLSRIQSARFIKPVVPGDQCLTTTEILKVRSQYLVAAGYVEVAGTRAAEAQFVAAILPGVEIETIDPVIERWVREQGGNRERTSLGTGATAAD
jgi:3-hydroxyacyl-[acyl-carrier-protein] dehydratase